jgi:DNA polymerase-3 subunit beta
MKVVANREQLDKKLLSVVALMTAKSGLPILNEALIQVFNDKMLITVSDSEITTIIGVPCENHHEEDFSFMCDIQTVQRTVALLKSEHFIIDVDKENNTINMSTPKTRKKYELASTYDPDDYPSYDSGEWRAPININGKIFSNMIKKAALFINPTDLRPQLASVHLTTSEDTLKVQGTDSTVMFNGIYKKTDEEEAFPELVNILIPKNVTKIISNYEKSPKVEFSIDADNRNIKLYDGATTTVIRLATGKYPNIEALYTEHNRDIHVSVKKQELSMAIKRLAIFSDKVRTMKIDMEGDNMVLSSDDTMFNNKAEELIEVEHKAPEMSFTTGINHTYLSGVIGTFPGETVYITQPRVNTPFLVTDDSSEGYESIWLIAAIKVEKKEEAVQETSTAESV